VNPSVLALVICVVAVALESMLLAGATPRKRLDELRLPPYSPPFALWFGIGAFYYAICFIVLRHLLANRPFTPAVIVALALFIIAMLLYVLWNVWFFRWHDLRASFAAFFIYSFFIFLSAAFLITLYPFGAVLLACYCVYLLYATWWAYQLRRLNPRA
jgi:tryptophan-rich sensory protein